MSLRDVEVRSEYRSLLDNVVRDFYIPLLTQATSYKRAVGFFSSSALVEISKGIAALARNGGTIQLVASPYLSDEDIEAIKKGYEHRDTIIKGAVLREMKAATGDLEKDRLNLLANLISDGIMDIKIAFTEDESRMGMYHEKMGVIADCEGNTVAFSGSMNESRTSMTLNYEAIDVFCSWKGEADRTSAKERAFESIWCDMEPNIRVVDFPELRDEIIARYRVGAPNFLVDEQEYELGTRSPGGAAAKRRRAKVPDHVQLHGYQIEAIDEWEKRGFRGIFDMATGTGKTYTGLGAVARLCDAVDGRLAVFIVAPFQHLVEQWVDDVRAFGMLPIVGHSSSSQSDWRRRLQDAIRDQNLGVRGGEFFCFVCTNATFSSSYVQSQIQKLAGNALLVVDEAHNFGAENLQRLLTDKFTYRLALSATIDRHNDPEGTARLLSYFGEKCIQYPLERAIIEGKLTPYKYYPIVTVLNRLELERYSHLTYEIGKCLVKDKGGKIALSERGKRLALARSRLVAGAQDKLDKLQECIIPYLGDRHILVYCGATRLLRDGEDDTAVDDEDLRQINAVTDLLGNKLNMRVSQFTSREGIHEREILKREFASGDTLQALIAIRCLDEGVNIPSIKVAFILASTTNPKEYIQRRGRVLRLSPGKDYAEIYDFITLPRQLDEVPSLTQDQLKKELTLVRNEISRGEEFCRIALNMVEAQIILDEIRDAYGIYDRLVAYEEDLGYGEQGVHVS